MNVSQHFTGLRGTPPQVVLHSCTSVGHLHPGSPPKRSGRADDTSHHVHDELEPSISKCSPALSIYRGPMSTRAQALDALRSYVDRMTLAIDTGQHHDQRRAILQDLLRDGFGLTVDELELERNVKVARTRGRIDLLYRTMAWEVKRDLDRERVDLERELTLYLTDIGERALGMGTDGLRFEAYRLSAGNLVKIDDLTIAGSDRSLVSALDWLDSYLFAIENVTPTTEAVLARFGLKSSVYLAAQSELNDFWAILSAQTTARTKRSEWARLLEVVYGRQVDSDELWIRHTYLVMVARIFAYLAIARQMPPSGRDIGIVTGELFEALGLQNMAERDFFTWCADDRLADRTTTLLRGIAQSLGVFSLESINEDLLKELYEHMVDPAEREWLGEFYTPDWLADVTLEEAGFSIDTRMLDPSCGSGTFIFAAIRRLRLGGLTGNELVMKAVTNIAGLDIHPLAVTVSRANFILALGDDVRHAEQSIQIPVYMADTIADPQPVFGRPIQIPAPIAGLKAGLHPWFQLPTERGPEQTATLEQLVHILNDISDPSLDENAALAGFRARLKQVGAEDNLDMWEANLRLMRALRASNRDTIWSFVLANSAKPQSVAAEGVDLVVGNPPWLTLMEMASANYKARVKRLATQFGLVPTGGSRMGNVSHIDTATVFAAFCLEHFLPADRGRVAFVLPRSVMTGATQHANFREGRASIPYSPIKAIDLDAVAPLFRIPSCVMIFDKVGERKAKPPSPWQWPTERISGLLPRKNASRSEADECLSQEQAPASTVVSRQSMYLAKAHQGVDIRPRVFWLVELTPDATVIDRKRPYVRSDSNAVRAGQPPWKGKQVSGRVESGYLFATSLDIDPFRLGRLRLAVLPVEPDVGGRLKVLSQTEILSRGDSQMGTWLTKVERIYQDGLKGEGRVPAGTAIDYLNTQQKLHNQRPKSPTVVWGKGGSNVRAAVVPDGIEEVNGLPVHGYVVDLNHYAIACATQDEAHYLAAMLNSGPVNSVVHEFQTRGNYGNRDVHRRPFKHVPIPAFDAADNRHSELVGLSETLHLDALAVSVSSRAYNKYMKALGSAMDDINGLVADILT